MIKENNNLKDLFGFPRIDPNRILVSSLYNIMHTYIRIFVVKTSLKMRCVWQVLKMAKSRNFFYHSILQNVVLQDSKETKDERRDQETLG